MLVTPIIGDGVGMLKPTSIAHPMPVAPATYFVRNLLWLRRLPPVIGDGFLRDVVFEGRIFETSLQITNI